MRRTEPVPGDLVLSGLLTVLAMAILTKGGPAYQPAGMLLLGGCLAYSLISALLAEDTPEASFRLSASLAFGLLMAALSYFFPLSWPWWAGWAALAAMAVLLVVAFGRRRAVPRRRRFVLRLPSIPRLGGLDVARASGSPRGLYRTRSPAGRSKSRGFPSGLSREVRVGLALLLILSATVLAYHRLSGGPEGYTELHITGLSGQVEAGSTFSPVLGLVNHEGRSMSYKLQVLLGQDLLADRAIDLGDNQSWEEPIPLILSIPGEQELQVMLYRAEESQPYRDQQIRVTVISPKSAPASAQTVSQNQSSVLANGSNQSIAARTAKGAPPTSRSAPRSSGRSSSSSYSSSSASSGGSSSSSTGSSSTSLEETAPATSEKPGSQTGSEAGSNLSSPSETKAANQSGVLAGRSSNTTAETSAATQTTVSSQSGSAGGVGSGQAGSNPAGRNDSEGGNQSQAPAAASFNTTASVPDASEAKMPASSEKTASAVLPGVSPTETAPTGPKNRVPIITAMVPTPDSPAEPGAQVTWTAQGFDPDGDSLNFRFLVDDKAQTTWSAKNVWIWQTRALPGRRYNVTVLVRDGQHALPRSWDDAASYEYQLILPNRPPQVTALRPSPQSPQTPGSAVTWTVQASDPNDDNLSYRFLINGLMSRDWSSSSTWVWDTAGSKPGVYNLTVLVRDERPVPSDRLISSQQARFTLQAKSRPPAGPNQSQIRSSAIGLEESSTTMADDRPPMVNDLLPTPSGPVSAGTEVVWTAQAIDPDQDPILYRFYLGDSPVTDWSGSPTWSQNTSGKAPGEYQVTVWVRDGFNAPADGYDSKFSSQITLSANRLPAMETLAPAPSSPQRIGAAVTWTASAADPEMDRLMYRFFLDGRPATDWIKSPIWTWNTSSDSAGRHKVEVRIIDGRHAGMDGYDGSLSADYELYATNAPPTLTSLTANPPSPGQPGARINWNASAEDPDGDPLQYMFQQDGKAVSSWTSSPSWSWETTDILPGSYRISVLVRDQNHAGAEGFDDRLESTYTITSRIDQELQRISSGRESGSVVVGRAASGSANQVSQGPAVPMKLGR